MTRRAWAWLPCVCVLAACESGNDLKEFSGRELSALMLPSGGTQPTPTYRFQGELVRRAAEVGCLALPSDVKVTLNGMPLQVFGGTQPPPSDPDGPCGATTVVPPTFGAALDAKLFLEGEPRNAVLEIQDGEERIVAEYQNFFARHSFAKLETPPTVKPGQELFLAWDPATDDLRVIEEVSIGGRRVPARAEAGGLRFTVPADQPAGLVRVGARASDIPAVRCEGVALCTAASMVIVDRSVDIHVQP